MYRSFVTCDDPKGVVECGTIRKSKVASMKMEEKSRNNRRDKSSKREEMARSSHSQDRVEEEYPSPCSFQLLEVSRGARKLNQLIDSWSKLSYEANHGQPKDVARELLKGALDLQDSLAMLGKLQEAKHYVSKLKKKQKEKVERGRYGEMWCERTNSYRFGFDDHRVSSDGSSGDAIEELRNAIKDGFARQNLLRSSMGVRIDSGSCDPSSSSSHSTDSLMSKPGLLKQGKAPNLIAKLMGLEDVPSEPLAPFGHIDKEKKKKLKADFDIEVLKARKPQPLPKMVESRRTTTLEEILQTAQCEGLIRSSSAKEHKTSSNQPTGFHSRRKSVDDVHPIVLIKPMRVPCYDPEQALGPIVRGDSGIDPKMMLRKMRIKQGLGPGSIDELDVTPRDSRMHYERELEIPNERIIREEGAQDRVKVDLISQRAEMAVREKKVPRKVEPEKAQVRRHSFEERDKEQKPESKRTEEKETKKKRRDLSPSKAEKQLKEEIKDKKVDKVQRVVSSSSRKLVERESLKAKIVLKSDQETKLALKKPRKPENGSITKQTTQAKMSSSKDQKHKEKPAKVSTAAIPVPEIVEYKEEEKIIDVTCEILSEKKEPSIEEEENIPDFRVEEQCGQGRDPTCSITPPSLEISSPNNVKDEMTVIIVDDTSHKGEPRLKKLLLNSPKFINLAENLFHLNQSHSKIPPLPETDNEADTFTKISSDYAEEFVERRSLRDSQTRNPLLLCTENPSISMSMNQLVEEIWVGIDALEGYGFDENRVDSIYGILERDMTCGGLVSGVWDLGWRNGFSVEDVEQSVKDLEVLIVGELIEEMFY